MAFSVTSSFGYGSSTWAQYSFSGAELGTYATPTGSSATFSIGNTTVTGTAVVNLTGSAATFSVGSLSFQPLAATCYTPGSSEISYNTSANAVAVLSYFVSASNKILINYVGAFGSYPQP